MAGNLFTVTDAGRAALVSTGNTGTAAHKVTQIGVSTVAFDSTDKTLKVLPGERKRIATLAGENVAADMIHVTLKDDTDDQYTLYGFGLYFENGVLFGTYSQATPIMEKSPAAMLLLAADMAFKSIDTALISFGDATFTNPPATVDRQGVVQLATIPQAIAGTDNRRAVTPAGLIAAIGPAIAGKSDKGHGHAIVDIDGLQSALDSKSPIGHGHTIANVSGLQSALDSRLGVSGGEVSGDVQLKSTGTYSPRLLLDANGYAPFLRSNSIGKTIEAVNSANGAINATLDDNGVLSLPRARPNWAGGLVPYDNGNLNPYTKAGGELNGNAPFQTRTSYANGAFRVLAPDTTGIGGAYAAWSTDRTPAMQIDTPNAGAAYMGIRWTHQGVRNIAAIDAYEGGSTTTEPTISMHLDGQANAWTFGRTAITRGAGGTVWHSANLPSPAQTTGSNYTGQLNMFTASAIRFYGQGNSYGQTMRGDSSGIVGFISNDLTRWTMQLNDGGLAQFGGQVWAANGGGRLCEDGNIYGGVWGGYLSNWLNSQINNRVPIRNGGWANQGYVVTNSSNSMQIWWDGRVQVQVDGSYQGYMWTSGNFDPGSKAQAGARVQWDSGVQEVGPIGNGTIGDSAPWVVVGGRSCGNSSTANCIWLHLAVLRNQ
ncbi:hypothetical protein [Burkholderia sp. S171]|uniref:hypothetical protein n=1 Tax=Burkholderia sp. S171 TaxID=1641860 RepID=UPI00131BEC33|nr:hypothetical protein [Burkholderia sp. S171]